MKLNQRNVGDGFELMRRVVRKGVQVPLIFFDPQYRTLLDQQKYGNEGGTNGVGRGARQAALPSLGTPEIQCMMQLIESTLRPSGYVMLWVDKFILVTGQANVFAASTQLQAVDMITWDKERMGMGARSRRTSEHLLILQKLPKKAKATWSDHGIRDVWPEKVDTAGHVHAKPELLQTRLIEAVTLAGDMVMDPCAGGFSVLRSCMATGRNFLGCDLNG